MNGGNTDSITLAVDLAAAWRQQVAEGKVRTEFVLDAARTLEGGPEVVHLEAGERVRIALELDADDQPRFVVGRASGQTIRLTPARKELGAGFTVELHPHRSLRPGADRAQTPGPWTASTADVPPEKCPFQCHNAGEPGSLLDRVPLAWVQLPHQPWACFPNGSVFDPSFHALWLPAAMTGLSPSLPHLPQRLTADLLADLVALHRAQAGRTVTLFQLLGAGATVGHCHAQSVAKPHTLPIELAGVRRAGPFSALADYPARGLVFNMKASDVSGCGALWRPIDKLQSKSHPYNLILIRDEAYLIVRNPEHIIVREWSGVLAGMELCGRAITHSAAVFDGLTRPQFAAALTKTTLPADDVLKLLGVP